MVKATSGRRGRKQKQSATIDLEVNPVEEAENKAPGQEEVAELSSEEVKSEEAQPQADTNEADSTDGQENASVSEDENAQTKEEAVDEAKAQDNTSSDESQASGGEKKRGGSMAGGLFAAIIGGAVALGGSHLLERYNIFEQLGIDISAITGVEQSQQPSLEQLQAQIDELKTNTGQDQSEGGDLVQRITALETELAENGQAGSAANVEEIKTIATDAAGKIEGLEGRVDAIDTAIKEAAQSGEGISGAALTQFDEKISGLESSIGETSKSIEGINERLQGLDGKITSNNDLGTTIEQNAAAIAKFGQTITSSDKTVGQLGERLTSLETTLNDKVLPQMEQVQQAADTAKSGEKIARSVAARSLSNVMKQGGSFSTELTSAEALLGNTPEIGQLQEIANEGIATHSKLLQQLNPVIAQLLSSQDQPADDAGVLDRFLASAKSLVDVKPAGPIDGDSPQAILSRVEAALKGGNSGSALKEWTSLPDPMREQASSWQKMLENRVQAEDLVEKVVRQLTQQQG